MPKQAQDFFYILLCNVVVVTLKSFDADIVFLQPYLMLLFTSDEYVFKMYKRDVILLSLSRG